MTPLTVEQLQGLAVTMADFEGALLKVQPSVRREGFTTKPDVTWEDVVRMHDRHAFMPVNTLRVSLPATLGVRPRCHGRDCTATVNRVCALCLKR